MPSSRTPAEVEALGSLDDRSGVIVDDNIEWERRGSGALEAQRSDLFSYTHSCNSKLIRAPRGLSSRDQVRAAPFRDLYSASLLSRVAARRKLLALMQIIADALSKWSCSWAT